MPIALIDFNNEVSGGLLSCERDSRLDNSIALMAFYEQNIGCQTRVRIDFTINKCTDCAIRCYGAISRVGRVFFLFFFEPTIFTRYL